MPKFSGQYVLVTSHTAVQFGIELKGRYGKLMFNEDTDKWGDMNLVDFTFTIRLYLLSANQVKLVTEHEYEVAQVMMS